MGARRAARHIPAYAAALMAPYAADMQALRGDGAEGGAGGGAPAAARPAGMGRAVEGWLQFLREALFL